MFLSLLIKETLVALFKSPVIPTILSHAVNVYDFGTFYPSSLKLVIVIEMKGIFLLGISGRLLAILN